VMRPSYSCYSQNSGTCQQTFYGALLGKAVVWDQHQESAGKSDFRFACHMAVTHVCREQHKKCWEKLIDHLPLRLSWLKRMAALSWFLALTTSSSTGL